MIFDLFRRNQKYLGTFKIPNFRVFKISHNSELRQRWYQLYKFEIFSRPYGLTSIAAATVQNLKNLKFVRPLAQKILTILWDIQRATDCQYASYNPPCRKRSILQLKMSQKLLLIMKNITILPMHCKEREFFAIKCNSRLDS